MSDLFNENANMVKSTTAKPKRQMRIVRLEAENVKRISAVEITPTGDLIQISGGNGEGKSSCLDSIWYALGGEKTLPAQPVRKGQEKASVRLDLGEIVVTRTFTAAGGSTLTVQNAEGLKYPKPQSMLDALLSTIAFDPLEFMGMKPAEQMSMIKGVVQIDEDIDELEQLNKDDFAQRTDINRRAKDLRAQAAGVVVAVEVPERVDVSGLMAQMTDASKTNAAIEQEQRRRQKLLDEIADNKAAIERGREQHGAAIGKITAERDAEIKRIDDEIKRLEQRKVDLTIGAEGAMDNQKHHFETNRDSLAASIANMEAEQATWKPLDPLVDVTAMVDKIESGQRSNQLCDAADRRAELIKQAEAEEAKAGDLTATMDERAKKRADAIASAKMPVEGMSFGDGMVLLDGLPLDQASTAQQLKVSCALAMAANPELRIIRIKDGDKLDDKNLAVLAGMAADNNFQVWMECVRSGAGGQVIVIEDGHVAQPEKTE